MVGFIESLLLLVLAPTVSLCLLGIRPRLWSVVSLALAGVVCVAAVAIALFEPVQHRLFPFEYEQAQMYDMAGKVAPGELAWIPAETPGWLRAVAEFGRVPGWSGPVGVGVTMPIPGVVYFDPDAPSSCGILGGAPAAAPAAEQSGAGAESGLRPYRGAQVLWLYLARPDTLVMSAAVLVSYGLGCVTGYHLLRRVAPWRGARATLRELGNPTVVVLGAWLAAPWPALAFFSHAFFSDLEWAMLGEPEMALGGIGVGAIWAGAALGAVCTTWMLLARAANAKDHEHSHQTDSQTASRSSGEAPVAAPDARRCTARAMLGRAVPWVMVAFLLGAPLTFPLVGRLLPESLLPVESLGMPVPPP
jgi:hypothetical protein